MNIPPADLDVYPPHLLTALDATMDALSPEDAMTAEQIVMDALYQHARGNDGPLMEAAALYPLIGLAARPASAA